MSTFNFVLPRRWRLDAVPVLVLTRERCVDTRYISHRFQYRRCAVPKHLVAAPPPAGLEECPRAQLVRVGDELELPYPADGSDN